MSCIDIETTIRQPQPIIAVDSFQSGRRCPGNDRNLKRKRRMIDALKRPKPRIPAVRHASHFDVIVTLSLGGSTVCGLDAEQSVSNLDLTAGENPKTRKSGDVAAPISMRDQYSIRARRTGPAQGLSPFPRLELRMQGIRCLSNFLYGRLFCVTTACPVNLKQHSHLLEVGFNSIHHRHPWLGG